jgi:hypothetical protein
MISTSDLYVLVLTVFVSSDLESNGASSGMSTSGYCDLHIVSALLFDLHTLMKQVAMLDRLTWRESRVTSRL